MYNMHLMDELITQKTVIIKFTLTHLRGGPLYTSTKYLDTILRKQRKIVC